MVYHGPLGIGGGLPHYAISVVSEALPSGLSLNSGGAIAGTPSKAGISSFTVKVTDDLGSSVSKKVSMKVFQALKISTRGLKKGKVGRRYNAALMATGGKGTYGWSLVSEDLPKGLSLERSTGEISGTSTTSGRFALTFQVADALAVRPQKAFHSTSSESY